jgi:hypothetical protein
MAGSRSQQSSTGRLIAWCCVLCVFGESSKTRMRSTMAVDSEAPLNLVVRSGRNEADRALHLGSRGRLISGGCPP